MHWPDENVEANADELLWCQQDVFVVTRQILLQVLAPLTLICGATNDIKPINVLLAVQCEPEKMCYFILNYNSSVSTAIF